MPRLGGQWEQKRDTDTAKRPLVFVRSVWLVASDLGRSANIKAHRFPVKPTKRQVRILVKKAKKDYVKNNALHILNELSKDLVAATMKELQEKLGK